MVESFVQIATSEEDECQNLSDPAETACRVLYVMCHIWFPENIYGIRQTKFTNLEMGECSVAVVA